MVWFKTIRIYYFLCTSEMISEWGYLFILEFLAPLSRKMEHFGFLTYRRQFLQNDVVLKMKNLYINYLLLKN